MMDGLAPTVRHMMTASGAHGNKGKISQLGGMRGLMVDPSGRIIDVPVRSNFREGLTVLEYFISTHGARKGLADTALRTADSGYLTRRLVDVAQDVITREDDCGTEEGSWIIRAESSDEKGAFQRRLVGRLAAAPLPDPSVKVKKGAEAPLLVDRNEIISEEAAARIDAAGVDEALVRSPLTCEARNGVCRACYGRNLATGEMVGSARLSASSPRSRSASRARSSRCARSIPAASPAAWTSRPVCRASRSCSRPASPRARPRSATSTASSRSSGATA